MGLISIILPGITPATTNAAPHRDCGSWNGRLLNIDVQPCDETVCVFQKGQNVTVHLEFVSEVNVISSWVALYGVTNPFFDHSFGNPEVPVWFCFQIYYKIRLSLEIWVWIYAGFLSHGWDHMSAGKSKHLQLHGHHIHQADLSQDECGYQTSDLQ